jgi:methionyl-tRNA synthetase
MKKPFYITTTLPYVNADPHIGFAVELIRADIIARAKKLVDFDVFFNTGTDEHGAKIEKTAATQGVTPQVYVDGKSKKYRELLPILGILPETNFIRTTDVHHVEAAQEFWRIVQKNGFIYKKDYSIKYCVGCELEKTDSDLVDGRCPLHPHQEIEVRKEENYFFKFSTFQKQLLELYKSNPTLVVPDFRFGEIKSFVERGLEDFSISRLKSKMSWGIPVPDDPDQVMYVWFDALVNYVSAVGWPESFEKGQTPPLREGNLSRRVSEEGGESVDSCLAEKVYRSRFSRIVSGSKAADKGSFKKWWIDSGGVVQYCGKDNLRQQSAMWQAMLMAASLPPSKTIVIDGFVTGDGGIKMSKSLGNTVDPFELVKEYSTDALRYFAARELHPFEDSPFTPEKFKSAYNAGLANGLGNLVSRVMKMAQDNLGKPVSILAGPASKYPEYQRALDSFNLKEAGDFIWSKISALDNIIQQEKPFSKIKDPQTKSGALETIDKLVKGLSEVAFLLEPFLPETSNKIQALIKENKMPEQPLFMRK